MNGIELFELIKRASSSSELLLSINGKTKAETQSKRGNLYEKLWDYVIKFGFMQLFPSDEYDHYDGVMNTCKLHKVDDLETYLQNKGVFSKGKGGTSDITLQHKISGKWVLMSAKYYLDDSKKAIDKYDVEKLLAIIRQHSHKYKEYSIYLLVNDKEKVLKLIESSQSTHNYIKENIHCVLDSGDLEFGFQKLKHAIQDVSIQSVNSIFSNSKIPLVLRFHQDLITYKMMKQIDSNSKSLLLGAKPRSGKTYCCGGLFIKYLKTRGVLNALIITPAPSETISQFTDDLFRKFRDFIGINIIEIKKGDDFESIVLKENNIIIVSKQLLDGYVFEKRVESIFQLDLDFIIMDENHFHGTTQMSKNILESYCSEKTCKVPLTGSYMKPLREWNIPLDCQFYWDIEDEQLGKKRNISGLVEKHGEDVLLFLTAENAEAKLSVYDKMPDLHIITNMMDLERYQDIKVRIKDTSYGFSNSTLFSGNFPGEVDAMLAYISGSNKFQDYPKKDLSIFGRIKRIAIENNSRTRLNNTDFTSQLWFLPFGPNLHIDKVSVHLKDRMSKNSILSRFEIKIVNSKKEYKLKDIKEEIKNWELKAKEEGKDGLILLAGNQLTLGITLPFVDIVFLLNDVLSSDKIMQMMYRAMTESTADCAINSGFKKMGFVVDLNISRVLNTILDYKKDLSIHQKISYLVENNLINIDADLFFGKENTTKLVEKLLDIWKGDPINNFKILLKRIEDNIIELDSIDQQTANHLFTSSVGDKKVNLTLHFDEECDQTLQSGREIIRETSGIEEAEAEPEAEEEAEAEPEAEEEPEADNNISISKDILPFVMPLICILTIHSDAMDVLDMLNIIKNDPSLLYIFNDQSFIWWNKPDIINFIEQIVKKYIKNNYSVYNIAVQFKMSLQSLIDKPKELLELIDSCLKPKQKEKQENGEVFTPMASVFEMLDNLDKHYLIKTGRSIFTERNFKWFDPAVGMGNFPVGVYLKLMDGLQEQIPDGEDRKKHIIENMLYMSELNKKNVFICHQIFNIHGKYKMHIYEGDTLELDIQQLGIAPNEFDVILGNPPYNKGGIRSHTGKQLGDKNETIWTKFIEKSFGWLKPDGFLVFINPLSWLKKSHSLHNEMLNRHIVWLKLWDNIKSLATINGKIPISLFILQNAINSDNKKTEIISEIQSKKLTTKSTEYLNPAYSIPLAFHSIFNKLMVFIEEKKIKLEYKTKTIKSSGTKAKIPTDYTLEDMWAVDTYTIKEGLMVKKATVQHPDANKRKLIIANKASFTGAFIDEGILSLTGNHKFYILGENLELVKKMLDFKIIAIIGHYTKYGQDFLDNEAFKYIPDIRKLGIADISESEFYDLIGLSPQEISQISKS